jgi:hypothetical protein
MSFFKKLNTYAVHIVLIQPYNQMEEKNNVQGGHVVGSSYNLKHDTVTSRPTCKSKIQ